jgi:hypothetical protein
MKRHKNILLILSSGGMMLSCFYACTSFVFASISQKPFPLPEATAILFWATIITCILSQQDWRRIYVTAIHLLGLLCSSLWLYHRHYKLEFSFWRLSWVPEFFLLERTISGWFTLILILLCVWILWFCGMRLWTKPTKQTIISHRFDLGLAFLFFLLLIKLVIVVKGGSIPMEPSSKEFFLSFIILGLFSMGLVRTKSASQEEAVTYIKGAGVVLSFMFITLMLGGGLFILFLPKLQTLAETGSDLFGTMSESIIQNLAAWAMASFKTGMFGIGLGGDSAMPFIDRSGGEPGIIHFLFIGLGIAILLFMVGIIVPLFLTWFFSKLKWLFLKLKWFFSKIEEENDKQGIWRLLLWVIFSVMNLFSTLWIKILSSPDTSRTAEYVFKLLIRWGRFSGLKHNVSETPKEYGIRLGNRFPQIEKEIRLIIHFHDEAIYGCILPDRHQISRTKLALRRIRSPLLWYTRIKTLCFHSRI